MVQVTKIGYAGFNTTHMDAMLAYYTEVIGFALEERGGDGVAYLSNAFDHHAIALYPSTESGLRHMGFQIHSSQTLQEVSAQLRDQGIQVETQTDAQPGLPELLQLRDPEGNTVQLYATMQPALQNFGGSGIVPQKLGHLALAVHDVQKTAEFYQNVLGFRVSDWIEDFFVFLRCGPDHHTINFLKSKYQKMHHIAFQLKDWAQVQQACDHLSRHGIPLLWGPGRHGAGHNIFTYHHDPDEQIVELFTELDIMLDEDLGYFEPRPWHEDFPQRPKVWKDSPRAVNHWGLMPSREFMFME